MAGVRFDTKIAIVVREDLAVWQKLNVTAFLSSAVAGNHGETLGRDYADGSGTGYLSMFRQPVMVFGASAAQIRQVFERALRRGLRPAVFTEDLFATGNDDDNRAAVAAVDREHLNLVGLSLYAPRGVVDKVMKGVPLHG